MSNGNKLNHDSYGVLRLTKSNHGGDIRLFGSSIPHKNTICVSINTASLERHLNNDYIRPEECIVEFEMSLSQFTDALFSIGSYEGTPCTITRMQGHDYIPPCPFTDKRDQFETEFKNDINNVSKDIKNIISTLTTYFDEKKPLNKSQKEEILNALKHADISLSDNIPFILSQFNEQMDKTVTESKGEIESFIRNRLDSISSKAIAEQCNDLLSLKTINDNTLSEKENGEKND